MMNVSDVSNCGINYKGLIITRKTMSLSGEEDLKGTALWWAPALLTNIRHG
jgi:hypothetical protein